MSRLSLTVIAIAVLAAAGATVAHEALGHGGACLVAGGSILRLSSVFFRCAPGLPVVDAAGPLGNLVAGGVALLAFRRRPHLFLLLFASLNLFWFAGYLLYSAVLQIGDWAFVARDLGLGGWWRAAAACSGTILYIATLRWIARSPLGIDRPTFVCAWCAATACALLAAAFDPSDPLAAMKDGGLEIGGASIGLLFARTRAAPIAVTPSRAWIAAGSIGFVLFVATLGRGIL